MATDNKDNKLLIGSGDYAEILRHAVAVIEHARTEIARHVNGYVSTAYWEIGQMLHERKIESGYGDRVAKRLSADLKERYPKMGVSPRNLWDMKKFYERFCHSDIKVRQAVALLPWGHILQLLRKVGDDNAAMLSYAKETRSKGWNCDLLLNAINLKMYETQALARVEVELALEDMGKPIGVVDCQLIVPKEKLQKVLADEVKAFSEEKENKEIL